jgi:hypothetical protein
LCPSSHKSKYNATQLTAHLVVDHQFPPKQFLQAQIRVKNTLRRVILHEMTACPIGGCNAGPQEFSQQRLISHVQKETHKPSDTFNRAIDDGYYFWWPVRLSNSLGMFMALLYLLHALILSTAEEAQISSAFTDPDKKEAALARIFQSPEAILDENDGAGGDIQEAHEDNDNYELDYSPEHIVQDPTVIETGSEGLPLIDEPGSPLPPDDMAQSPEVDPSPVPSLMNIPNLHCPIPLLRHNFAILHLPYFIGSPVVPVCIKCRTVINSADYNKLRVHQCEADNNEPTNLDPTQPLADNQTLDEEMDAFAASGVAPLDPNDVPPMESTDGIDDPPPPQSTYTSWQDIRTYFNENKNTFVKVTSVWPTNIIAPIPFLPIKNGYGCPVPDCSHSHTTLKWAKDHARKHTSDPTALDYQYDDPPPCTMQTLGTLHGKASNFRVSTPDAAPSTPDGSLTQSEFIAISFAETNHHEATAVLRGLPFKSPFFKRFDYQSIYPLDPKDYTNFVTSRLNRISPSYKKKQKPLHQLLAVVTLVYTRSGGFYLHTGPHNVRRYLGNKLR